MQEKDKKKKKKTKENNKLYLYASIISFDIYFIFYIKIK